MVALFSATGLKALVFLKLLVIFATLALQGFCRLQDPLISDLSLRVPYCPPKGLGFGFRAQGSLLGVGPLHLQGFGLGFRVLADLSSCIGCIDSFIRLMRLTTVPVCRESG